MHRATVDKHVLDRLIRAKLASMADCQKVSAMPVVWQAGDPAGSNWTIPGWAGPPQPVADCTRGLRDYLQFLRTQFVIPDEG